MNKPTQFYMFNKIQVLMQWDDKAKVWSASSTDIKGLAVEASSIAKLEHRLQIMLPELIKLNQ